MGPSDSFNEVEENQSEQTQRKWRGYNNSFEPTISDYDQIIDDRQQCFQNFGDSQEKSPIEIGGFEPFTFPFPVLIKINETHRQVNKNEKQLYLLDSQKGRNKYFFQQNDESNTELNDDSAQKSTQLAVPATAKHKKIQNKRKFEITFKASLLNYQPGEQTKFYLFLDRVLDINYLKLICKNQGEEINYIHEENKVCVFKGNKIVNSISHRIDNKCIEVISEEINRPVENFQQIINMLLSLGDLNLFEMTKNLQHFWDNILKFQIMVKTLSEDALFRLHMAEREKASNEMFLKLTSEFEQDQYIHYVYFKVDYDNYRLFNCLTGFSPKLYELVAGNAYAFKESLLKEGFYDPIYLANRLHMCLDNYLSMYQPKNSKTHYYDSKLDHSFNLIKTLDGFLIPSLMKRELINMNIEYDTQNNLNFKVNDFLAVNFFQLIQDSEEDGIENQLRDFRRGQKYSHESDQEFQDINRIKLENQFKNEDFLQKYYPEEIQSLMSKGSKWFKQCGIADIPQKKRKEQQ